MSNEDHPLMQRRIVIQEENYLVEGEIVMNKRMPLISRLSLVGSCRHYFLPPTESHTGRNGRCALKSWKNPTAESGGCASFKLY